MGNRKTEWEQSYGNLDNFLFHPNEEVIRFVSKHIRKRIGLHEFRSIASCSASPRVLDLGCGIGRHVIFAEEMGLDAYGIDLSAVAVATALAWAAVRNLSMSDTRVVVGDIRALPWPAGYFDYVISHGVLDSMDFDTARQGCAEAARVIRPGGLFYCDLISGDDSTHAREFAGEQVVETVHEKDTIQSYFNFGRILELIAGRFSLVECRLLRSEDVLLGGFTSRYHLVLRKETPHV